MEGLKKYRDRGIPVLIDGEEADESQWEKIFEIQEDGSFYMGDYVLEEADAYTGEESETESREILQDSLFGYGKNKRLKEIRFDLVYHR